MENNFFSSPMVQTAIVLAAFVGIFSIVVLIAELLFKGDKRVKLRIDKMFGNHDEDEITQEDFDRLEGASAQLFTSLDSQQKKISLWEKFNSFLELSGFRKPQQKLTAIVAIAILFSAILYSIIYLFLKFDVDLVSAILFAISSLLLGGMVVMQLLKKKQQNEMQKMVNSLSDFMDLLVVCLESGISLDGALRRVTEELSTAHPALASEMRQVQREVELGTTLENAFYHLAHRTGLQVINTMACFIEQSRRYGTSISDALREHSDMIRDKREIRAESLAQEASMKILLPTLLLIFPATFVVLAGPAVMEVTQAFSEMERLNP